MTLRREIPWLQVVRFHKEVTRRAEEGFFALPAGKADSERWSSLGGFEPAGFAGPWVIHETSFVSRALLRSILRDDAVELFLGGPCWFQWRSRGGSWYMDWMPVLYRQVRIVPDAEGVLSITPEQGNWEFSPLVFSLLDRKSAYPEQPLEEWLPELMERIEAHFEDGKEEFTPSVVEILSKHIPELGEELHAAFPVDRVSPTPTPWVLFTPPTSMSALYRHLMSDYEHLEQRLKAGNSDLGGLELLEDVLTQEEPRKIEVLPIVPLNDSQLSAVRRILEGRPTTVISGPPGCGKSQVVVSTLLNAWSKGIRVLFASNNNKAVDVVKERVEHFETDFPIAVRAGSQRASNLEEALRRTLNMIASGMSGRGRAVDTREKRIGMIKKKESLFGFLESGVPQRVDQAKSSALRAYASFREAVVELARADSEIRAQLGPLGYNEISAESFVEGLLDPFRSWLEMLPTVHRGIEEIRHEVERLNAEKAAAEGVRNRVVQTIGLDPTTVGSWEWLTSGPGPEVFESWMERYRQLLSSPIERALETFEWREEFEAWNSSESVSKWLEQARKFAWTIPEATSRLETVVGQISVVEREFEQQRAKLGAHGIPIDINVDPEPLFRWTAAYAEYCVTPPTRFSWLPWSSKTRLRRELSKVERRLRSYFPLSLWQRVGALEEDGREKLGRIMEETSRWIQVRRKWEELEPKRQEVSEVLSELRSTSGRLGIRPAPISDDLDQWAAFCGRVDASIEVAEEAKRAWGAREAKEAVTQRLQESVTEYESWASGVPVKEAWVATRGGAFDRSVMTLANDPSPMDIVKARTALYSEPTSQFVDAWQEARDAQSRIREVLTELERLPTKEDLISQWWIKRPAAVAGNLGLKEQLPAEGGSLFRHFEDCVAWHERWRKFTERDRPLLERTVEREREWADEKLQEAVESIPTQEEGQKLRELISGISGSSREWPTDRISQAFSEFSPERIKARIKQIDEKLESLAFEAAREEWGEALAENVEIQDVLEKLLRHYKRNRSQIREEDYDLFREALAAVPIWITTAQSSQSIPLIPGLFDVLVIDEATQCTLTNLLPLIYRAKRVAVIGDPEQLPAIPSLSVGAEQVLARNFGIIEWLDLLGHAQNNVYSTMVKCLPRRHSDVISLVEHYRSHPLIIGFSNQHVYQRRLRLRKSPGDSVAVPCGPGIHGRNVRGSCERGDRGRSWVNKREAEEVIQLIQELRKDDRFASYSIGVVTPFRAQEEFVIERLDAIGISRGVQVGTAYKYQGDEQDVMIFSPVISKGITDSAARWVETPRNQINVAVTRAREALFFVADYGICRRQPGILGQLTRYAEDVARLRKTSLEELDLFSWMVVQGWSPEVHPVIADIEVDFVLRDAGVRLAIEVDGRQHEDRSAQDGARDAFLQAQGYDVLRFPAREVRETPAAVIHAIADRLGMDSMDLDLEAVQ